MRSWPAKVVCCLLIFLLPLSSMAADAVGMISVSGQATIDDQPAGAKSPVFAGARIVTGRDSHAVVLRHGAVVSLSSDTHVRLDAKALELTSGAVVVSSDQGAAARVDGVTISTPAGTTGKFLARRVADEVELLALNGDVYVSGGGQQETVPANTGVKIKLPRASSGVPKMSVLGGDDVGLLIVVAAAIAGGVALGVYNATHGKPSSPATP
jgi:hypothetical protein